MGRTPRMTRWLWLAWAVLLLAAGYEGLRLRAAAQFDAAVRSGDLEAAGAYGHPHGAFAAALSLQRRGELERLPQAYAAVPAADPALRAAVRFNLANSYLRRAFALGDSAGGDLVEPLIELAKQEYRDVLRAEPAAWDARYNLELALSVQPDLPDADAAAEANPEHSRQSIATQRVLERLP